MPATSTAEEDNLPLFSCLPRRQSAVDILLVHGNPLDDLAVLAEPAAVWARGVEANGLS